MQGEEEYNLHMLKGTLKEPGTAAYHWDQDLPPERLSCCQWMDGDPLPAKEQGPASCTQPEHRGCIIHPHNFWNFYIYTQHTSCNLFIMDENSSVLHAPRSWHPIDPKTSVGPPMFHMPCFSDWSIWLHQHRKNVQNIMWVRSHIRDLN